MAIAVGRIQHLMHLAHIGGNAHERIVQGNEGVALIGERERPAVLAGADLAHHFFLRFSPGFSAERDAVQGDVGKITVGIGSEDRVAFVDGLLVLQVPH